jgi:hypothetical protein
VLSNGLDVGDQRAVSTVMCPMTAAAPAQALEFGVSAEDVALLIGAELAPACDLDTTALWGRAATAGPGPSMPQPATSVMDRQLLATASPTRTVRHITPPSSD